MPGPIFILFGRPHHFCFVLFITIIITKYLHSCVCECRLRVWSTYSWWLVVYKVCLFVRLPYVITMLMISLDFSVVFSRFMLPFAFLFVVIIFFSRSGYSDSQCVCLCWTTLWWPYTNCLFGLTDESLLIIWFRLYGLLLL